MEHALRLLIVFGISVLIVGICRGEHLFSSSFRLAENASLLRQQIDQLRVENQHLALEITKLKNSKSYARKVLRDKYHLVDTGEKMVFLTD